MLVIDESAYPIVVIEVREALTSEDVLAFTTHGDKWLGLKRPYATVIVAGELRMPGISKLRQLAAWMKAHLPELDAYHRVSAYVTTSPMVRGVLRAALGLQPIKAAQIVTGDREEAIAFARRVLGEAR
jgi:hypothetical protein